LLFLYTYAKGHREGCTFPTDTSLSPVVGGEAADNRRKRSVLEGLRPSKPPACISPILVKDCIHTKAPAKERTRPRWHISRYSKPQQIVAASDGGGRRSAQ